MMDAARPASTCRARFGFDLKTLMIYRDNARQLQGQASKILADLFSEAPAPRVRRKK